MNENAAYTQAYLGIMNELDGDPEGRRAARAFLEQSTAVVHGEVVASSFVPRLFGRSTRDALERISTTMHGILCKVMAAYLDDPAYRALFSFDPRLEELILLPRGYDSLLPFARVDVFLNEDDGTATFCEFNADGSSGMNEDREIVQSVEPSETYRRFAERHRVRSSELFDSCGSFPGHLRHLPARRYPRIAICDYLENATLSEFEVFARTFSPRRGSPSATRNLADGTVLRDGDDSASTPCMALRDERRGAPGRVAGTHPAVEPNAASSAASQVIARQGCCRVPVGDCAPHARGAGFVKASIPHRVPDEEHIDLAHEGKQGRLSPIDHYGADEVYVGAAVEQGRWNELVDRFADEASGIPFLAQTYQVPYRTLTVPLYGKPADEDGPAQEYNNLSGLYLYDGQFAGVFSRLGPSPLISGKAGGITAPTIWVDC
ncbi:MAG: carboxylate--amine ligase [Eggerthellaceae bacterium]